MTAEDHDALVRELLETERRVPAAARRAPAVRKPSRGAHPKSLLSQDDEIEEKRIKVHKLALKDRMEIMVRQYDEDMRATA
jgi:hypothetical protein